MNRLLVGLITGLCVLVPALPASAHPEPLRRLEHRRYEYYKHHRGYPVPYRAGYLPVPRVAVPVVPGYSVPAPVPGVASPVVPGVAPLAPYTPAYGAYSPGYYGSPSLPRIPY